MHENKRGSKSGQPPKQLELHTTIFFLANEKRFTDHHIQFHITEEGTSRLENEFLHQSVIDLYVIFLTTLNEQ